MASEDGIYSGLNKSASADSHVLLQGSAAEEEREAGPTSNYNFSIVHRLTSAVNERAALVFLLTGTVTVQGYAGCNYELRVS
ncbi:unnamed protein product [Dibothriocephalus latus]|uniref:Uncharacterized protein n=1 Tax=Dibothriocephalus latus TaxID=60516 RepID=A0A3P7M8F9_DIBLA|nr:unnamed protein product [Dibothriocephalus latus]